MHEVAGHAEQHQRVGPCPAVVGPVHCGVIPFPFMPANRLTTDPAKAIRGPGGVCPVVHIRAAARGREWADPCGSRGRRGGHDLSLQVRDVGRSRRESTMYEFDTTISSAVERIDSAPPATGTAAEGPLSPDLLGRMHRYWQAANYLTVGQIYLLDNPLLARAARAGAHQAAAARPLGNVARAQLRLRAPESADSWSTTST